MAKKTEERIKKKKSTQKEYSKCVRCGSVAMFWVDFGLMGKLGFCPICWAGLTGCMARDFYWFNKFDVDYLGEMGKAWDREKWFKEQDRTPK